MLEWSDVFPKLFLSLILKVPLTEIRVRVQENIINQGG